MDSSCCLGSRGKNGRNCAANRALTNRQPRTASWDGSIVVDDDDRSVRPLAQVDPVLSRLQFDEEQFGVFDESVLDERYRQTGFVCACCNLLRPRTDRREIRTWLPRNFPEATR